MKYLKILLYPAIFIVLVFILNTLLINTNTGVHSIKISQNANGSSGDYWDYELSEDGILIESDYYTTRFFLNLGPGYSQIWKFSSIGCGEVTIHWIAYESGSHIVEENSYSVTYIVDENGIISKK